MKFEDIVNLVCNGDIPGIEITRQKLDIALINSLTYPVDYFCWLADLKTNTN